ncbi:MAG: PleD family two-component system response regulator [Candidatus Methylomirabilales bacterium]
MGARILVVDDEPANRELLEAILTQDGYTVVLAEDAAGAIAAVRTSRPDLILLDLMMPGIDGLELCRALKRAPRSAGIPVIVVTAMAPDMAREAALASGADDCLTKPIHVAQLRARVGTILEACRIAGRTPSDGPRL